MPPGLAESRRAEWLDSYGYGVLAGDPRIEKLRDMLRLARDAWRRHSLLNAPTEPGEAVVVAAAERFADMCVGLRESALLDFLTGKSDRLVSGESAPPDRPRV